ncbi:4714_t:CDS:2, partial [Cetraspora pellucida]
ANQLVKQNNYWVKISHSNRSVFVWDTSLLFILPNHKDIESAYHDQNSVYIKLQVPEITVDTNEPSLLLGFTNTENVQWLCGYIRNHFTNIFNIEKQLYQEEKEVSRETQLKSENWESMQQIIQGLGQKLKNTTSELQNTCKKLY